MHRSTLLMLTLLGISAAPASSQTAPPDSQTLQAILAELRQLRHDLQTTSAMAPRAQIALYRLQRENEAVVRATQRVSDARSRVSQLEDARIHKAHDIEYGRAQRSDDPKAQQEFEEVLLPRWKSDLELLQRQEQQARTDQAQAEQLRLDAEISRPH